MGLMSMGPIRVFFPLKALSAIGTLISSFARAAGKEVREGHRYVIHWTVPYDRPELFGSFDTHD